MLTYPDMDCQPFVLEYRHGYVDEHHCSADRLIVYYVESPKQKTFAILTIGTHKNYMHQRIM